MGSEARRSSVADSGAYDVASNDRPKDCHGRGAAAAQAGVGSRAGIDRPLVTGGLGESV